MRSFVCILCLVFGWLSFIDAGTVRLINDSPYRLRAVVRAADGTMLGEMVINSRQASVWSDQYSSPGEISQPEYSQTPYTVLWYCMNGDDYSFCGNVGTGAMVTAQTCDGARLCKPTKRDPKKEPPVEGPTEEVIVPYNRQPPESEY
jgi:hypothetical protein